MEQQITYTTSKIGAILLYMSVLGAFLTSFGLFIGLDTMAAAGLFIIATVFIFLLGLREI